MLYTNAHTSCFCNPVPVGSVVRNLPALGNGGDLGLIPEYGGSLGEGNTPVFLTGKSLGQRRLGDCHPRGQRDTTE